MRCTGLVLYLGRANGEFCIGGTNLDTLGRYRVEQSSTAVRRTSQELLVQSFFLLLQGMRWTFVAFDSKSICRYGSTITSILMSGYLVCC